MKTNVTPGETPEKITVSMIDQDLKDGISKPEMAIKYGIKPWEVDEIFKHPLLKGRRPSRKKALSFTFEDDMTDVIDPNQITLEDVIEESTKEIETAVDRLADVNNAIVDMLGPHTETPEETLLKAAVDTLGDPDEDYELGEAPSFEDTLDLVKEQQEEEDEFQTNGLDNDSLDTEEEIEMDDDTFEL